MVTNYEIKSRKKIRKSWESTSDSIATWLYSNTKSDGLIFIKSLNFIEKITLL